MIIAPWLDDEGNVAYEVLGYCLDDGTYTEIEPDERGWVYSAINDVWIGPTERRDSFLGVDAESNERILPAEERVETLEAELARLREELARNE